MSHERVMSGLPMMVLEDMVDQHGLRAVLATLAEVCGEKASHLSETWQDDEAARAWRADGRRLEHAAAKVEN